MQRSFVSACAGLVAATLSAGAHAQLISAEDFARHGEISEVAISPGGDYIALAMPRENGTETELKIVRLDGSGHTQVLRFGKRNHVTDVVWTADEQVTVARAKMEPLVARPQSLGELISSDVGGNNQQTLFAHMENYGITRARRNDEGFASIVKVLDNEPGMALVSYDCWSCGEEPNAVIYKVDTLTGERREVERVDGPAEFIFDNNGIARIMAASGDDDEPRMSYRPAPDSEWQSLPKALAGYVIANGRFQADNNVLYALLSDAGEPLQLYRIDLAAGSRQKLAGRDDVDVSHLLYAGRQGPPFAVAFLAGSPTIQYLDPDSEWARLHKSLMQRFPGELVHFVGFSRGDRKLVILVQSDRNPGGYYVLDRDTDKLLLVSEFAPWMEPSKLARMQPIKFSARDGTVLYGFHTTKESGRQPLVVVPHGGPHGVHDEWGYNSDVQFLASRGYAVLQVNYRGSGGRGAMFQKAGWREWGGKIQDDIADGVRWAVQQGFADPERVCIYGASFGGYAALMNPIRHPDMYQCAIGHVGVYDLQIMFEDGDIHRRRSGRRYLERVLGSDRAVLALNSPAQQVAKIAIPVMLAQGKLDRRVPMEQFNALAKAFVKSGRPAKTLVVDGEGHGFYDPKNQARLYREMEAFLEEHIGEDAPGGDGVDSD